jgi:large subunit ribosomal protein L3
VNETLGLIGKKLGNTQVFQEDGEVRRVTAIQVGPCVVLAKRTVEKDGYSALQIGFGEKTDKHVRKPQAGVYQKLGVKAPKVVREFRVKPEVLEQYQVGQTIAPSEIFAAGHFVDVSGTSKGRGFTGVMRRHNFRGSKSTTHGNHEYNRHGGSIGTNMTPGRVLRGVRMPGQHGNAAVTVQSLKVVQVLADESIVLVEGGVPGPRNGFVTLRYAVKKKPQAV